MVIQGCLVRCISEVSSRVSFFKSVHHQKIPICLLGHCYCIQLTLCVCMGGGCVCVCEVGGGCVCEVGGGVCGSACERQVRALKENILYTIYVLLIDCLSIVQSW